MQDIGNGRGCFAMANTDLLRSYNGEAVVDQRVVRTFEPPSRLQDYTPYSQLKRHRSPIHDLYV